MPATQSVRKPSRPYLRRGHPITQGLVGAWPFFEGSGLTVHDVSGWANHGSASARTWILGNFGPALNFSTTPVTVSDAPALDITGDWTVSCWLNSDGDNAAGNNNGILSKGGSTADDGYTFQYEPGGTGGEFSVRIDANSYDFTSSFVTGTWKHYVMAHDSGAGESTLYVDGDGGETISTEALNNTNDDALYIGRNAWNSDDALNGDLELMLLYNRQLSQAEANSLYEQPLVPFITKPR